MKKIQKYVNKEFEAVTKDVIVTKADGTQGSAQTILCEAGVIAEDVLTAAQALVITPWMKLIMAIALSCIKTLESKFCDGTKCKVF